MKLIFSHNDKDYISLDMKDKIFIINKNRKFIYELKEQTYKDWLKFKQFTMSFSYKSNNWGSVVLYCSENNLKHEVCKKIKKQYKK